MEALGAVNNYECKHCNYLTVTLNMNVGTTPFGIKCPRCGGYDSYSTFYRLKACSHVTHVWYRPDKEEMEELEKKTPGWRDHILNGGLILKRIEDEINPNWSYEQFQERNVKVYYDRLPALENTEEKKQCPE